MTGAQFTLFGGNSNNRAKVGTFYCNLNNTVSNAVSPFAGRVD